MLRLLRAFPASSDAIAWAAIFAVGLFLRILWLAPQCATRDECFSWRLVQYPLLEQIQRTAADVHPPLYYILLSTWSEVAGLSMLALRGLSVVLGLATILLLYFSVIKSLQWADAKESPKIHRLCGLLGAGLVAVHPVQVDVSRTARMYSLGMFLAVLTSLLMLLALRARKRPWLLWTAYGISTAALWYTHYFGVCTTLGQLFFLLGGIVTRVVSPRRHADLRVLIGVALAVAIAVLLYSPWLPAQLNQIQQVRGGYWIPRPSWGEVADAFVYWSSGVVRPSTYELVGWTFLVILIVTTAISCVRTVAAFWLLQAVMPWLAALAISWTSDTPLFQPRYMVFAHVAWIGLVCTSASIKNDIVRLVLIWMTASICLLGSWEQVTTRSNKSPAVAQAMESVVQGWQKGDVVLTPWWGEVNRLRYYAWTSGGISVPVLCERPVQDGDRHYVHVASLDEATFISIEELAERGNRVWMVASFHGSPSVEDSVIVSTGLVQGPGDVTEWTVTLHSFTRPKFGTGVLEGSPSDN